MKEAIAQAASKITECYSEIRKLEKFIRAAQDVCKHEWVAAPDLFDYHNGVDYQRCQICGKVE